MSAETVNCDRRKTARAQRDTKGKSVNSYSGVQVYVEELGKASPETEAEI